MANWKTFSLCYFAKVPQIENIFKIGNLAYMYFFAASCNVRLSEEKMITYDLVALLEKMNHSLLYNIYGNIHVSALCVIFSHSKKTFEKIFIFDITCQPELGNKLV